MTNPNDSAYPMLDSSFIASGRASHKSSGSFTKREIVLKDFMCAIITGNSLVGLVEEYHIISERADEFVKVYINQLNKQS